MKKHLLKSLLAVALLLVCGNVWGDNAPVNTVLWSENFAHFDTNTPSDAGTGTGTTIYGGATITYAQSSTNTKGYNEKLAGGTAPELLLSKSNQTWTISGIPTGGAKKMSLTFLSNKNTFTLTTTSQNYTVSGSQKSWTLTLGEGVSAPETIDLTLKNTSSSNARIDNVELKVTVEGGDTPTKTLESIAVSGTAADLWTRDEFSHEGITVTANWDDNTQTDVTSSATFSGYDMTTAGEQTVTVTYEEQTTTYTINVQTIANTEATAYTVTEAKALIDGGKGLQESVFVTGVIKSISEFNTQYHNATYVITDSENDMTVFRGKYLDNADFTSVNQLVVGAEVVVTGSLTLYNNETYEIKSGNYLVSYTEPVVPTYSINVAELANGTITTNPEGEAAENAVVTLTINPAEHYQLSTLTVTDANEIDIDVSGDYTFTMPACDVTISATFTEKAKHTVTYMSLGAQVGEAENVYDGELCANMPDVTNIPEDWTFAGWTTQSSYAMSTTAPAMFSATTPVTADVTLYAVFARTTEGGAASGWYKVTENPSDWSGEYLLVYEGGKNSDGDTFSPVAWTGVDAASCGTGVTIADGVIAAKPDDAATLTIAPMTGGYSIKVNGGEKDGQYIYGASGSNVIKFGEESLNALSYDEDNKTVKIVSNTSVMRYNYASGNSRFRYYKSASFGSQQPVQLYKYTSGGTTFYTITTPQAQDITISSVGWATACVPFKATVSGATAYTAKVEDGALAMTPITVIPAGTGVLLESVDGGATTATFTESGLEGDDVNGNQLCGNATNAAVTWSNEVGATAIFTYYIFANDAEDGLGFYWQKGTGGNSVSCGAYKAALVVPGAPTTESGAIGYRIGGTTMVEQMLNDSKSAEIYDILGRKVENATKGLYIINGKKVLVK